MISRALFCGWCAVAPLLVTVTWAQESDTSSPTLPTGSELASPDVHFDRAERASRVGNTQEATTEYARAEGSAHFLLGKIALRRGDLQNTLSHFDIAQAAGADGPEFHYWRGVYELNLAQFLAGQGVVGGLVIGAYTDALDRFDRALDRGSDRPEAWVGKSQAQFSMFRFDEALATLEKGIGRFPDDPYLLGARADIHLNLYTNLRESDAEAARSHWENAVGDYQHITANASDSLTPYQVYAFQKTAEAYQWQEDVDAARDALVAGIERDPAASGLYSSLYGVLSRQERLDELADFLKRIAEENPGVQATPLWYLGFTEHQRQSFGAAIDAYRRSAQANPEYIAGARTQIAEAHVAQGALAQSNDDPEMALSYYLRALDANPEHPSAITGVGSLGALEVAAGNESARRFFAKVTSMYEDHADWWNNYAFFCRETENFEESYRAYRRAIELSPEDARILNDCALIALYHLDRDLDQAEEMFFKAWRNGRAVAEDESQDPAVREEALVTYGDAMENLVRLFIQQNKLDEATDVLDELMTLGQDRPMAENYRRNIAERRSGDGGESDR